MSASQLWSPAAQRPAQNAATTLNTTTSPAANGNNYLSLSPIGSALPSPAMKPTEGDEVILPGKFLTNHGPSSRASSFSSTSSGLRQIHPSLGQRSNHGLNIERREMAVARAGGITSAFATHH